MRKASSFRPLPAGWRFWQTRLEPGGYVLAVCAEQKEGEEQEEGRGMTYEEIFQTVKERLKDADVSGIGEHLAFQLSFVLPNHPDLIIFPEACDPTPRLHQGSRRSLSGILQPV